MTNEIRSINPSKSYIMPETSEGSTHQARCTDQRATLRTNKPVSSLRYTTKKLPIGQVTLIILTLVLILPSLVVLVMANSDKACNEGSLQLKLLVFEYQLTTKGDCKPQDK